MRLVYPALADSDAIGLLCSSVNFVKTFASDASAREKVDALRKACKTHTALTKECSAGLGHDRILYAMYCLAQEKKKAHRQRSASNANGTLSDSDGEESDGLNGVAGTELSAQLAARIPDLFKDPGYGQLGHTVLSTSNCGDPSLAYFGFGPVVSDGLGIGYIIKVRGRPCSRGTLATALTDPNPSLAGRLDLVLRREQAPPDAAVPRRAQDLPARNSRPPAAAAPGVEPEAEFGALPASVPFRQSESD